MEISDDDEEEDEELILEDDDNDFLTQSQSQPHSHSHSQSSLPPPLAKPMELAFAPVAIEDDINYMDLLGDLITPTDTYSPS